MPRQTDLMDTAPVVGLLLAAGEGRRIGTPKALLRDPDGTAWVQRQVSSLRTGGCRRVVVVVGARGEDVAALLPGDVAVVRQAGWREGMGASLRAGLAALPGLVDGVPADGVPADGVPADVAGDASRAEGGLATAALVALVDTPGMTSAVVERVVALAAAGPQVLARAAFGGVPGHPVLLGRDHWAGAAAQAHGDSGARGYLRGRGVVLVECCDVGHGLDVDSPPPLA